MAEFRRFAQDRLAESYLFDTSYLIHLVVEGQNWHDASVQFLERLTREQGSRRVFLSPLTYAEFAKGVSRLFLIDRRKLTREQAEEHLRNYGPGDVANEIREAFARLNAALDKLELFQVPLDYDLWIDASGLMLAQSMQPYDSIQLASAYRAGCTDLVTFDRGFERLERVVIWRP